MDSPLADTVELGVAAFAGVEAVRSTIPAFRKQLNKEYALPPSLLKYAEEQTVVSLAAVLHAIRDFGLKDQGFCDWGVVSGPRFLGREPLAGFLDKFRLQGALGASPLITPYLSLHAVSGTISLALQSHGPNLGVGGSKGNLQEALLASLTMREEQSLPGVWVTVSEWDPEPIPHDASQQPEPVCKAVSLALTSVAVKRRHLQLRLVPDGENLAYPTPTVADLAQFLANGLVADPHRKWSCVLAGNWRLELASFAPADALALSHRAA
jgi:hypothetical protein